jgi:endonuclease/exonuclease/phosphatase family metal-dependent hydrolase
LRPRSVVALSLVTGALLIAGALWTLGVIVPLRPFALRAMLVASPLLALVALPIGRERSLPWLVRFATALGAGVCAASSVLFVVAFVFGPARIATGGFAEAQAGSPQRLRVVSFNVLHDYPRLRELPGARAADLARALESLEPDVVLLQEAWCFARQPCLVEALGEQLGMTWAWAGANGSELIGFEEGCAILSRHPLIDVERWDLRPRARPWRRRAALLATLELGERPLRLVCAHLENASRVATEQARELAVRLAGIDAVTPDGVLVGADLNLDGASNGVRRLREAGLADLFPDGIDHVLLSEGAGWSVSAAEPRLGRDEVSRLLGREVELSDHAARLVELARR